MIFEATFNPIKDRLSEDEMLNMREKSQKDGEELPILDVPDASFFSGIGEASWKGPVAGAYKSVSALETAISSMGIAQSALQNYQTETGEVIENIGEKSEKINKALDYEAKLMRDRAAKDFGINPETMGTAAQFVYGIGEIIPKAIGYTALMGPSAGALAFGADLGISRTMELQDQGVDKQTAINAGLLMFGASAIGVKIPATFGKSRAVSATLGAGINAGLTSVEMTGTNWILRSQNYEELSKKYELNMLDLAVSAAFGGVIGGALWRPSASASAAASAAESASARRAPLREQIYNSLRRASHEGISDEAVRVQADLHSIGISRMAERAGVKPEDIAPDIVYDDSGDGFNQIIGSAGAEQLSPRGLSDEVTRAINSTYALEESLLWFDRKRKNGNVEKLVRISELPEDLRKQVLNLNHSLKETDSISREQLKPAIDGLKKKAIAKAKNDEIVKTMHRNRNLDFKSIGVADVRNSPTAVLIHKSRSHNGQQGSSYYLDVIDGRLAYIRVSNHWGEFSTNIYEGDPAAATLPKERRTFAEDDPFGRVGTRTFNWRLDGEKLTKDGKPVKTSQAGYVFIDDASKISDPVNAFVPDNALIQKAKENFGTTNDIREAFYVLPDGTMLDGSGRHWGGRERDVAGQRQVNHSDIGEIIDDSIGGGDAIYKWMARSGAMRFDQIAGIASVARKPTREQLSVLARASRGKYLALSLNTPEGRIIDDIEFESASPSKINHFFEQAQIKADNGVAGAWAQRAWHGSPHIFDEFSTEHIGTGEGAQAHGWGLYFAGDRSVADGYRNRLSSNDWSDQWSIDGRSLNDVANEWNTTDGNVLIDFLSHLRVHKNKSASSAQIENAYKATKNLQLKQEFSSEKSKAEYVGKLNELKKKLTSLKVSRKSTDGRVFEVDVPDNDLMLDEQKLFADQSKVVQKAVKKLLERNETTRSKVEYAYGYLRESDRRVMKFADRDETLGVMEKYYEQISKLDKKLTAAESRQMADDMAEELGVWRGHMKPAFSALMREFIRLAEFDAGLIKNSEYIALRYIANRDYSYMTGAQLYDALRWRYGSPKEASLALNTEGVKGITYEGGRDGRCYVVFDDKAIKTIDFYQRQKALAENASDEVRGLFNPSLNRITLTPNANLSTFSHEMGHWYLSELMEVSKLNGVDASLTEDVNALLKEFGVKNVADWEALGVEGQRKHQETFANWVEIYLSEGKAPNSALARLFERLSQWIVDVYRELGGTKKAVEDRFESEFGTGMREISPEVRKAMDRLLAKDREVTKSRKVTKEAVAAARMVQSEALNQDRLNSIIAMPDGKDKVKALRDFEKSFDAQKKVIRDLFEGRSPDVSKQLEGADLNESAIVDGRKNFARVVLSGDKETAIVLQNRDRSSDASINQMTKIASNPVYGMVSISRSYTGSPIVSFGKVPEPKYLGNTDFIYETNGNIVPFQYAAVESQDVLTSNSILGATNPEYGNPDRINAVVGNGRVTGLKSAYEKGFASEYRANFEADTEHGIDPDVIRSMKNPILVRVISPDDVTTGLISRSNAGQELQRNATEIAFEDSAKIRANIDDYQFDENGEPTRDTVALFLQDLGDVNALGALMAGSAPNKEAIKRLKAAVFYEAYKNDVLTSKFASETDTGVARIMNALSAVAPKVVRLRQTLQDLDVSNDLVDAVNEILKAKTETVDGKPIVSQGALFGEETSAPFVELLSENANSSAGILRVLNPLLDWAQSSASFKDGGLFGEVDGGKTVDLADMFVEMRRLQNEQRALKNLEPLPEIDVDAIREAQTNATKTVDAVEQAQNLFEETQARVIDAIDEDAIARERVAEETAIEQERALSREVLNEKTSDQARLQMELTDNPDQLFTFVDEDGRTVHGTFDDLIARADDEIAKSDIDEVGLGKAIECAIKNGGI